MDELTPDGRPAARRAPSSGKRLAEIEANDRQRAASAHQAGAAGRRGRGGRAGPLAARRAGGRHRERRRPLRRRGSGFSPSVHGVPLRRRPNHRRVDRARPFVITESLVDQFETSLPFKLDAFQREAIEKLDLGRGGVLVSAPTSSGKTIVAEYAIYRALKSGLKVLYTTPLKALSNQKYHDFVREYGESVVGLVT